MTAEGSQMDSDFTRLMDRLFAVLDGDRTSQITWPEFIKFQAEARDVLKGEYRDEKIMDSKSLRSEFDAFDTDGNGVISKDEFMAMMGKLYSKGTATGVKALSDIIEVVITRQETKDKPSNVGEPAAADPRDEFIRAMLRNFEAADADRDGVVTFSGTLMTKAEFLRHEFSLSRESNVQRLRAGFRRLDLDGNGFVTRDEVRALAERVYDESH